MFDGGLKSATECMPMAMPVDVRLKQRRQELLNQVADLEKAIAILDEQPKLLEALNVLRRVGI